jgi:hypothetical protein
MAKYYKKQKACFKKSSFILPTFSEGLPGTMSRANLTFFKTGFLQQFFTA